MRSTSRRCFHRRASDRCAHERCLHSHLSQSSNPAEAKNHRLIAWRRLARRAASRSTHNAPGGRDIMWKSSGALAAPVIGAVVLGVLSAPAAWAADEEIQVY